MKNKQQDDLVKDTEEVSELQDEIKIAFDARKNLSDEWYEAQLSTQGLIYFSLGRIFATVIFVLCVIGFFVSTGIL